MLVCGSHTLAQSPSEGELHRRLAGRQAHHERGQGQRADTSPFQSPAGFSPIPSLVNDAISRRELPGAVVLVGRGDEVLFRGAFGRRAVEPAPEPMTEDTIFDVASLTKVV